MTKLESKIDRKYNCQQVRINNNNRAQIEYKVWFLVGFKTIQECKKNRHAKHSRNGSNANARHVNT